MSFDRTSHAITKDKKTKSNLQEEELNCLWKKVTFLFAGSSERPQDSNYYFKILLKLTCKNFDYSKNWTEID